MSNYFSKALSVGLVSLALTASGAALLAQDHAHDPLPGCDAEAVVAHQLEHAAALENLADDLLHDPDKALEALYTTGIAYQALAMQCGFDRMSEVTAAHELDHELDDVEDAQAAALLLGDPENGAAIFTTVQPENGFACSTCHLVDSTERLIGPGLQTVGDVGHDASEHAEDEHDAAAGHGHGGDHGDSEATAEAQTARTLTDVIDYIRTSILHPNDFVVPGFPADLMPQNYAEVLTEDEVNDLIAYLLTLE